MSDPTSDPGTQAGDDLLSELADDFLHRCRAGEHPSVDEYAGKHPELADRIRDLFPAMLAMEQPGVGATRDFAPLTERVGSIIGRYKLLERIGEGGFGVVYMAEQQHPVRRKVALKVVKPGMDSRQVLARFEAERQALAIMDHPNIAKVFDAGATDSGRPYFVMELVRGEPITEFCDRNHFSPHQRLELFSQVCHAVQHAHQKGIIHRDIKPTNVLAAMHDTTPVVKVIDFGVAKALGQELTDKTLFTGFAQLLGTPLYMSPEQAGQSALDIDTRSDIYSLGVLLYELLTGTTPFDKERFQQAAHDEICRIIREEEPPRPSTRLSSLSLGERAGVRESLASVAAQRHTEPARLTKLVRGELDWIVMKALEKDRNRRYETANAFTADVLRYLADEPVLACPPSAVYRMKKFVRRNKAKLSMASVIGVALLFAVGSIGWMVRDQTARQARVAGQVEQILTEVDQLAREQKWSEALSAARRAEAVVTSGDADAATAKRVREQLKDLKFIDRLEQIRMQQSVWVGLTFDYAGADRGYADAFRQYGVDVEELGVETSIERFKARPAICVPVAAALDHWMGARVALEMDSAAQKRLVDVARGIDLDPLRNKVRATRDKPDSENADELRRLAESIDARAHRPATLDQLASILLEAKHSEAGLRLLRDAQSAYPGDFWLNFNLGRRLTVQKDYEGAVRFYTVAVAVRPNAGAALNNLALVLSEQGKLHEAIAAYRKASEVDPKLVPAYNNLGARLCNNLKDYAGAIKSFRKAIELDPKCAVAYSNLGNALSLQGKVDESIAAYRKAIELDPKDTTGAYLKLGAILCDDLKDYAGAIESFRKALELDPISAKAHSSLGTALAGQGKVDEAIAAWRKALELAPKSALTYSNLGEALRAQGKLEEANGAYHKASELGPISANAYSNLGIALAGQGKVDEAIAAYRKAIELNPKNAGAYLNFGALLCDDLKDYAGAIESFRKAIELDPKSALPYISLGVALYRQEKLGEATAAYRQAIELDPKYALTYSNLGEALQDQEKLEEANAAYRKAIELDPKSAWRREFLGDRLREQQNFDEAVEAYRKAIEMEPGRASSYVNLGKTLFEQKKADEAIAAYSMAIESDPKTVARVYNDIKEMSKDEDFEVLRDRDDFKKLVAAVQARRPVNERAWELATDADASRRDPSQAVALADQAVAQTPTDEDCWNTLGVARYRAGDFQAAIAALEKYRELRQGNAEWGNPFFLAMAHWQLGNQDEARTWYDKAVEWMDATPSRSTETMKRFRAETAELLGVNEKKQKEPSSTPSP